MLLIALLAARMPPLLGLVRIAIMVVDVIIAMMLARIVVDAVKWIAS